MTRSIWGVVGACVLLVSCGVAPVADESMVVPITAHEPGAPPTAEPAAMAEVPALRDVAFMPGATCDLDTAAAVGLTRPEVRQLVLVTSAAWVSTDAVVSVAVRSSTGEWRCQTDELPAKAGRNGTRPLLERRSGDDTAPAGVFPLGTVTAWDGQQFSMFGNLPDPGVRVPYRAVRRQDCWGATPGTANYNVLFARERCPGPDDEWLPQFGEVYGHAAVIGANLDPVSGRQAGEPAYAAAIFLHRHSYTPTGVPRATSGCVSLSDTDLVDVLRLLDPALQPHFAIGPVDWLRRPALSS